MSCSCVIRLEQPADFAAVERVHRLAFGRENEARLVAELRQIVDFDPQLSLVAVDAGGDICGHVLFTPLEIMLGDNCVARAQALAPVAVTPAHQREGIGSALIRAGLRASQRAGHSLVFVVGHPDYYPRFGFKPARACGFEAPFPVRNEAFMVLDLSSGAGVPASARTAGLLRYAEPFSRC